jgi:hypothetical protein
MQRFVILDAMLGEPEKPYAADAFVAVAGKRAPYARVIDAITLQ